jgi:hypothetical protein
MGEGIEKEKAEILNIKEAKIRLKELFIEGKTSKFQSNLDEVILKIGELSQAEEFLKEIFDFAKNYLATGFKNYIKNLKEKDKELYINTQKDKFNYLIDKLLEINEKKLEKDFEKEGKSKDTIDEHIKSLRKFWDNERQIFYRIVLESYNYSEEDIEKLQNLLKQFKENITEEYLNQLSQTLESLPEEEKENFLKTHYKEIKKYFGKDGELVNDIVSIEKRFNEEIEKNKDNEEIVKELEAKKREEIDRFVRQQRGKINTVLGILKKLEFEQQKKGKNEEELKKIKEEIYKDYFKEVDNILDLIKESQKATYGKNKISFLERLALFREKHPFKFYLGAALITGLIGSGIGAGIIALKTGVSLITALSLLNVPIYITIPTRFLSGILSFLGGKAIEKGWKLKERGGEFVTKIEQFESLKELNELNKELEEVLNKRIENLKIGRRVGFAGGLFVSLILNMMINYLSYRGTFKEIFESFKEAKQLKVVPTETTKVVPTETTKVVPTETTKVVPTETTKVVPTETTSINIETPTKPTFKTLTIGKRGIEGAYIDHYMKLKDNKDAISNLVKSDLDFAKKFFGIKEDHPDKITQIINEIADKKPGKFKKFIGAIAHRKWEAWANEMLKDEEFKGLMKKLNYSQDMEGLEKMMRKILKGTFKVDESGNIQSVDAKYLKNIIEKTIEEVQQPETIQEVQQFGAPKMREWLFEKKGGLEAYTEDLSRQAELIKRRVIERLADLETLRDFSQNVKKEDLIMWLKNTSRLSEKDINTMVEALYNQNVATPLIKADITKIVFNQELSGKNLRELANIAAENLNIPKFKAKNALTESLFIEYFKSLNKDVSQAVESFQKEYGVDYGKFIENIKDFKKVTKSFNEFLEKKNFYESNEFWKGILKIIILNKKPEDIINGIRSGKTLNSWLIEILKK